MKYELKIVSLDGEYVIKLRCPNCGVWGIIDDDQYHGRVSTHCSCGFHETVNFKRHGKMTHPKGLKIN